MRILIVTHAPLSAEFGASQIALNLAEALRAHGNDVTLWSPQPVPLETRWWRSISFMRERLDEFLRSEAPFDIIDSPSTLITAKASRSATVIARSTQPDLLYLANDLMRPTWRGFKRFTYLPFEYLHIIYHTMLVFRGWSRARWIYCLGRRELQWMRRWFPWWKSKLRTYVIAPSAADRFALTEVHKARLPRGEDQLQFLWIGRWVAHKGRRALLKFVTQWNAARPQDTFTIAGCGADAEQDCPAVLLRSGVIKIIPTFTRSELPELLGRHHAGLFTSTIEGWGLSLNEMLESGMPVFATEAGGVSELREFLKEEVRAFPPKLNSVSCLRQTLALPESYLKEFSWPNIASAYLECLSPKPSLTSPQSESAYAQRAS